MRKFEKQNSWQLVTHSLAVLDYLHWGWSSCLNVIIRGGKLFTDIVVTNFSLFSSNAAFPPYVMNKVSLNQTPYYNAVSR